MYFVGWNPQGYSAHMHDQASEMLNRLLSGLSWKSLCMVRLEEYLGHILWNEPAVYVSDQLIRGSNSSGFSFAFLLCPYVREKKLVWSRWIEQASAGSSSACTGQSKQKIDRHSLSCAERQRYVGQLYLNLFSEPKICMVSDICR